MQQPSLEILFILWEPFLLFSVFLCVGRVEVTKAFSKDPAQVGSTNSAWSRMLMYNAEQRKQKKTQTSSFSSFSFPFAFMFYVEEGISRPT